MQAVGDERICQGYSQRADQKRLSHLGIGCCSL
jgi:hypothetical protein